MPKILKIILSYCCWIILSYKRFLAGKYALYNCQRCILSQKTACGNGYYCGYLDYLEAWNPSFATKEKDRFESDVLKALKIG